MRTKLIEAICTSCTWYNTLKEVGGRHEEEWGGEADARLESLLNILPSGSGIYDVRILVDKCTDTRVEINLMYQHMNEYGSYIKSTGYRIIVKASLRGPGFTMDTRGDRDARDYIDETFFNALQDEVELTDNGYKLIGNDSRFFKIN